MTYYRDMTRHDLLNAEVALSEAQDALMASQHTGDISSQMATLDQQMAAVQDALTRHR